MFAATAWAGLARRSRLGREATLVCYKYRVYPQKINTRKTFIIYANEPKHKRAHIDLLGTIFGKFHGTRPSSFAILARTHTHTDTHTQTDNPVFRNQTITIHSINEND